MKGFSGKFQKFYNEGGIKILKYPSAEYLFDREVLALFEGFRSWLRDKFMPTKGLTIKQFRQLLKDEGFSFVTKRK